MTTEKYFRCKFLINLGVYTPAEAAEKIVALERQTEAARRRSESERDQAEARGQFRSQMGEMLDILDEWIASDEPLIVNRLLSALIARVTLFPDRRIQVELR